MEGELEGGGKQGVLREGAEEEDYIWMVRLSCDLQQVWREMTSVGATMFM